MDEAEPTKFTASGIVESIRTSIELGSGGLELPEGTREFMSDPKNEAEVRKQLKRLFEEKGSAMASIKLDTLISQLKK